MSYRAIERVRWQDRDGHTNVLQAGETTDDPLVVAHSPESFEDTDEDNEMGEGTSAAEQKGLGDPEGSTTIEQGKLNQKLREGSDERGNSLFASSNLPTSQGSVTSSGAEIGSKEAFEDAEKFRADEEKAGKAAEERNEKLVEKRSRAIGGLNADAALDGPLSPTRVDDTRRQRAETDDTRRQRSEAEREAGSKAKADGAAKDDTSTTKTDTSSTSTTKKADR